MEISPIGSGAWGRRGRGGDSPSSLAKLQLVGVLGRGKCSGAAVAAGCVRAIDLTGCQLEPPVTVAQVLSVASEVSRSRLRVAQVLAFCCALHDRMGADSAICDMVDKGVVDIWQIVASIVHARHGHEGLCSTLACQNPWYEVCVRGLVPEGVPHS